jgi:hypothetical protein
MSTYADSPGSWMKWQLCVATSAGTGLKFRVLSQTQNKKNSMKKKQPKKITIPVSDLQTCPAFCAPGSRKIASIALAAAAPVAGRHLPGSAIDLGCRRHQQRRRH